MIEWNCEKLEKQKKMYTMLVVSSVLFFQSSRNTLAMAPKTGSANEGRKIEKKITSEPAQTAEFRSQDIFLHNERQWCGHHTSAESDECLAQGQTYLSYIDTNLKKSK